VTRALVCFAAANASARTTTLWWHLTSAPVFNAPWLGTSQPAALTDDEMDALVAQHDDEPWTPDSEEGVAERRALFASLADLQLNAVVFRDT
jgi:hypothetical protein